VGAAPNVDEGQFSILVASFRSRERAEYVVAELNGAGYRARAVEHDWGPPRGRLVHVSVGGYASAIDVERDLRRIRDLPGGYRDAHIVDRQ
jgi:cell division septation protein DedD